ncbi:Cilia- and flagella-associated protein 73 [Kappamyces sp. JEL0829]|nr:Cilia- and flagella-associated protein 73 [Kappamyces sp. JEL0829]
MEEFFRADIEKKLLVKVPKQEDHELTPATRLLERRREMLEVENGLQKQKEEFSMKMESLSQRREELARKEAQLKESLLKFDKFLQENDAKRLRAVKKAIEERKVKDQKEQEISELKESQQRLIAKKDTQGDVIEKNMVFHSYLENLLENNSEYVEVKDIISRFDTLAATNAELLERSRQAQEKTESDRQAFTISSEEKNNMILNCNNQIAKLQAKLEEAKSNSAKWQGELDDVLKNASQKSLLLGQVKM